jgi:transcriptional regulator with XRE-family HTH domain
MAGQHDDLVTVTCGWCGRVNVSNSLGRVVKYLRSSRGLTQEQTAAAVHVSTSLIAMIETGRRLPMPDTARRLDEHFDSGDLVQSLAAEARTVHRPEWLQPWTEVEDDATALRWHEPNLIPGLLQTEAYARAVLDSGLLMRDRVEAYLTLRMERQEAVLGRDEPPVCTFLVDQSALVRGEPVMLREQLLHLVEISDHPRIFVHVVPVSAGLHRGQNGSFVLARLADGMTFGFVDDQLQGRLVPEPAPVAALEQTWQAVSAVALPCDQSRDLIMKSVNEL